MDRSPLLRRVDWGDLPQRHDAFSEVVRLSRVYYLGDVSEVRWGADPPSPKPRVLMLTAVGVFVCAPSTRVVGSVAVADILQAAILSAGRVAVHHQHGPPLEFATNPPRDATTVVDILLSLVLDSVPRQPLLSPLPTSKITVGRLLGDVPDCDAELIFGGKSAWLGRGTHEVSGVLWNESVDVETPPGAEQMAVQLIFHPPLCAAITYEGHYRLPTHIPAYPGVEGRVILRGLRREAAVLEFRLQRPTEDPSPQRVAGAPPTMTDGETLSPVRLTPSHLTALDSIVKTMEELQDSLLGISREEDRVMVQRSPPHIGDTWWSEARGLWLEEERERSAHRMRLDEEERERRWRMEEEEWERRRRHSDDEAERRRREAESFMDWQRRELEEIMKHRREEWRLEDEERRRRRRREEEEWEEERRRWERREERMEEERRRKALQEEAESKRREAEEQRRREEDERRWKTMLALEDRQQGRIEEGWRHLEEAQQMWEAGRGAKEKELGERDREERERLEAERESWERRKYEQQKEWERERGRLQEAWREYESHEQQVRQKRELQWVTDDEQWERKHIEDEEDRWRRVLSEGVRHEATMHTPSVVLSPAASSAKPRDVPPDTQKSYASASPPPLSPPRHSPRNQSSSSLSSLSPNRRPSPPSPPLSASSFSNTRKDRSSRQSVNFSGMTHTISDVQCVRYPTVDTAIEHISKLSKRDKLLLTHTADDVTVIRDTKHRVGSIVVFASKGRCGVAELSFAGRAQGYRMVVRRVMIRNVAKDGADRFTWGGCTTFTVRGMQPFDMVEGKECKQQSQGKERWQFLYDRDRKDSSFIHGAGRIAVLGGFTELPPLSPPNDNFSFSFKSEVQPAVTVDEEDEEGDVEVAGITAGMSAVGEHSVGIGEGGRTSDNRGSDDEESSGESNAERSVKSEVEGGSDSSVEDVSRENEEEREDPRLKFIDRMLNTPSPFAPRAAKRRRDGVRVFGNPPYGAHVSDGVLRSVDPASPADLAGMAQFIGMRIAEVQGHPLGPSGLDSVDPDSEGVAVTFAPLDSDDKTMQLRAEAGILQRMKGAVPPSPPALRGRSGGLYSQGMAVYGRDPSTGLAYVSIANLPRDILATLPSSIYSPPKILPAVHFCSVVMHVTSLGNTIGKRRVLMCTAQSLYILSDYEGKVVRTVPVDSIAELIVVDDTWVGVVDKGGSAVIFRVVEARSRKPSESGSGSGEVSPRSPLRSFRKKRAEVHNAVEDLVSVLTAVYSVAVPGDGLSVTYADSHKLPFDNPLLKLNLRPSSNHPAPVPLPLLSPEYSRLVTTKEAVLTRSLEDGLISVVLVPSSKMAVNGMEVVPDEDRDFLGVLGKHGNPCIQWCGRARLSPGEKLVLVVVGDAAVYCFDRANETCGRPVRCVAFSTISDVIIWKQSVTVVATSGNLLLQGFSAGDEGLEAFTSAITNLLGLEVKRARLTELPPRSGVVKDEPLVPLRVEAESTGEVLPFSLRTDTGDLGFTYSVQGRSVYIASVAPGSPAADAGLLTGSLVCSVDGVPVHSKKDFKGAVKRAFELGNEHIVIEAAPQSEQGKAVQAAAAALARQEASLFLPAVASRPSPAADLVPLDSVKSLPRQLRERFSVALSKASNNIYYLGHLKRVTPGLNQSCIVVISDHAVYISDSTGSVERVVKIEDMREALLSDDGVLGIRIPSQYDLALKAENKKKEKRVAEMDRVCSILGKLYNTLTSLNLVVTRVKGAKVSTMLRLRKPRDSVDTQNAELKLAGLPPSPQ
eukprot:Sspe_Gene.6600::Locus_2234_Transcript_1_2_Confidence_0.667_Length_7466::g.6600::m.6600